MKEIVEYNYVQIVCQLAVTYLYIIYCRAINEHLITPILFFKKKTPDWEFPPFWVSPISEMDPQKQLITISPPPSLQNWSSCMHCLNVECCQATINRLTFKRTYEKLHSRNKSETNIRLKWLCSGKIETWVRFENIFWTLDLCTFDGYKFIMFPCVRGGKQLNNCVITDTTHQMHCFSRLLITNPFELFPCWTQLHAKITFGLWIVVCIRLLCVAAGGLEVPLTPQSQSLSSYFYNKGFISSPYSNRYFFHAESGENVVKMIKAPFPYFILIVKIISIKTYSWLPAITCTG